METAIVLGLLAVAVVLFALERISVDIITLMLLIALVATGILTTAEAFAGFSRNITIILAAIFIISGALQRTGVMDAVGAHLYKIAGGSQSRLMLVVLSIVGGISGFMNNTTATAIFVPPVIGLAKRTGVSASKLLMPVAFASILGGTCTLIGTSTNIAVSGFIEKEGMEPLSMFDVTPIGIVLVAVGIAYLMLVGKRLLPDHKDESLTDDYAMREYLSEIIVMPDSDLIGQPVFVSELTTKNFRVLEVIRGDERFIPDSSTTIEMEDVLLVEGKVADLIKVKDTAGIEIRADVKLGLSDLESDDVKIAEVLIAPRSNLIGRTLKEFNFRARYGLTTLAIYRRGESIREKIGRIPLRMGDLLLVQGTDDNLKNMRREPDLWTLEEQSPALHRKKQGIYTVIFFAAAIIIGVLGWLPLSISFLSAAVLTILFRCVTIEEAYKFIDWRLIILIGGMTAFGTAMNDTHSGAASQLANLIVTTLQPFGVLAVLGGFFVITVLLTQPMSNAAAALVVLPVAMEAAEALGVSGRTFAIAIMLAASVSFIAPFEPACILVYGPGKYRFLDFVKVGLPLTLILMTIIIIMVPMFFPL
ncbi:MAG: SLC13 family permease [Acidobacteriota bacterium]|nr:SLC13 family permease [Acidobacteriota bacterium]